MANNITEVLHQIQETTKANLQLLKTINESFVTQREHVSTIINGEKYTLPSFIYLESKLNVLEENFKNLVNAPQTGEAAFVFDGNTQSIAMQRYTTTPKSLKLNDVTEFKVKENVLFKDLVTPNLYVRVNVEDIPNDISHVVLKKITFKNEELINRVTTQFNKDKSYISLYSVINGSKWIRGVDFDEYDTEVRLPSLTEERYGEYHISTIISQDIDSDFIQHYKVRISEDPVFHYTLGVNTSMQDYIKVGDTLLCNNGTVKLRVDEIIASERMLTLTVLNNGYANLTPYIDTTQDDTGVLTYFTDIMNNNKYVDVTLEEDNCVAIFIAPLNKMNVRASFGEGILINADTLKIYDENRNEISTYREYYDTFVNNVGDTLSNLTKVFNNNIFQMSYDRISKLLNEAPVLTKESLKVLELNTHLKDNTGVEELIKYDADKINTKDEIRTIQNQIDDLRNQIKNGKFTGEISGRADAEARLSQLENDLDNKNSQLVDLINTISKTTNNNDLSASNIKYRIRGFFDVRDIENRTGGHKVIKIIVQYQYVSKSTNMSGGARAITTKDGNINYLISDWTTMPSPYLSKTTQIKTENYPIGNAASSNGLYVNKTTINNRRTNVVVDYPTSDMNQNTPSFNQIDIPINAGESVNIRVRVQYEDGYPFFETLSPWSNEVSIQFPTEYETAKPLLTIIEENISDADKYRFVGAMEEYNVIEHVRDEVITEEGATFFHKCEHVTSGFYTSERRDIPLRDKLQEMDALLNTLENEIYGVQANELKVTLSDQRSTIELKRDSITPFFVPGYDWSNGKRDTYGNTQRIINLTLTNTSNYNINLYSMFPGAMSSNLTSIVKSRFDPKDYCVDTTAINTNGETIIRDLKGVWIECFSKNNLNLTNDFIAPSQPAINLCNQHLNQFLYFRINDPNDGTEYYKPGAQWGIDNVLSLDKPSSDINNLIKKNSDIGASLLPMLNNINDITIPTGTNKKVLKPGESVSIALDFRYLLSSVDGKNTTIEKTMSFDIRPSLYADPINYTFKVCANFYDTLIPASSRTAIASENFIIKGNTSSVK